MKCVVTGASGRVGWTCVAWSREYIEGYPKDRKAMLPGLW